MKKLKQEMLVTGNRGESRVALLENGELAEVYIEKSNKRSIVNNIYMGRVTTVLPGMSAAFIDIGVGKNALLYFQDLVLMENGTRVKQAKIGRVLRKNDRIMVQVTKDPMQGKGARLTTYLSIPGRLMVYMPRSGRSGVSRRLPRRERDRLRKMSKSIKPQEGGIIIRTAAKKARKKDLVADLDYLTGTWKKVLKNRDRSDAPSLLYSEPYLAVRLARDVLTREYKGVLVDSKKEYNRLMDYLSRVAPEIKENVVFYEDKEPLFKRYGVERGIEAALRRRVGLPSGGHIVVDEAEALTAIDVNTGSFTGRKSIEDTALKTNTEAAEEIVRQLRLRDIGGIIVIDFIDMDRESNRASVLEKLEKELEKDRTKTQVVTLSELGLVEMTRKNVTEGLVGTLGQTCPKCEGRGLVFK